MLDGAHWRYLVNMMEYSVQRQWCRLSLVATCYTSRQAGSYKWDCSVLLRNVHSWMFTEILYFIVFYSNILCFYFEHGLGSISQCVDCLFELWHNCDALLLDTYVTVVPHTSNRWTFYSMPSNINRRWWRRRRSCLDMAKWTTKLWKQCKVESLY